jgi:hypothetical protein
MNRNKVAFYYSLYEGREPITDEYGNVTGEYDIKRGNPIKGYANISAAKGETETRQFGESITYDKVIVMDGENFQIDEYSVLWVDTSPMLDEDGSLMMGEEGGVLTPHDYIVMAVAKSLNSVSIAISKVNVQ